MRVPERLLSCSPAPGKTGDLKLEFSGIPSYPASISHRHQQLEAIVFGDDCHDKQNADYDHLKIGIELEQIQTVLHKDDEDSPLIQICWFRLKRLANISGLNFSRLRPDICHLSQYWWRVPK